MLVRAVVLVTILRRKGLFGNVQGRFAVATVRPRIHFGTVGFHQHFDHFLVPARGGLMEHLPTVLVALVHDRVGLVSTFLQLRP